MGKCPLSLWERGRVAKGDAGVRLFGLTLSPGPSPSPTGRGRGEKYPSLPQRRRWAESEAVPKKRV